MPPPAFDPRLTPGAPRPRRRASARPSRGRALRRRAAARRRRAKRAAAPPPDARAPLETEALHGEAASSTTKRDGWAWAQLDARRLCRLSPGRGARRAVGADPSRRRVAHPRLSRPEHQAAAALRDFARRALAIARFDGRFRRRRPTGCITSRAISRRSTRASRISSRSPSVSWRRPISGAGALRRGSTAPASSQTALTAAGIAAPRDSDMMEAALGAPLGRRGAPLRRGDLVFWKGHVGVMRDARRCCTPTAGTCRW